MLLLTLVCAALASSARAGTRTCHAGYTYAGVYATTPVSGLAASLSMITQPNADGGHVAGWVGVGGPGLGPNGADEWLQVGLASFDGPNGRLYYELALPGKKPQFVELASGIQPGEVLRVGV